ncbi:MAG TPA: DUF6519 domain-containing protein [Anaerolineales bacterium]|nr:DUF6519 domain-containing protein [Anaerolineales bacterium]
MKADITRDTFDQSRHFSRVLAQQGRPQLDADFNEQAAILLHRQQTLAADLIGSHGAPPKVGVTDSDGFLITMPGGTTDFMIGKGHYYVDGILCENEGLKDVDGIFYDVPYTMQPDYHPPTPDLPPLPALAYLDVWERHLTYLEVEDADGRVISIRESALNGPDTATRAKVVWQVKVKSGIDACPDENKWKSLVEGWQPKNRGLLKSTAVQSTSPDLENSCITPPKSRYRGAENQLYRVEIHKSGNAGTATFKWSRDNGSILFPVTNFTGATITLATLGRDQHSSLEPGQWVELVDDNIAVMDWREREVNPLGKITAVDRDEMTITVDWPTAPKFPAYSVEEYQSKHVLLRRWDHQKLPASDIGAPRFDDSMGTCFVDESPNLTSDKWLTLENGIKISFALPMQGNAHSYRAGDYWLIPARVAAGDVEWPGPKDDPMPLAPHGVEHHYAPLALITSSGAGGLAVDDCRHKFTSGIGPDSDLQVHNLDVGGSLSVTGDTALNGKVGIGTANPSNRLSILDQTGQSGHTAVIGSDILSNDIWRNQLALHGTAPLSEARLGFATTEPGGTGAHTAIIKTVVPQDGGGDLVFQTREAKFASIMERMRITNSGNVGIGTATPSVKLEVAGEAAKPGGGSWTSVSDLKLKKNVKSLEDALDVLLQLRGVSFEWKEPEKQGNLTGTQMGMVAQEVESVFPGWVGTNPDGTKNLTIRGFEALVVEAVRELNTKVDGLLQRMETMEQRLDATASVIHATKEEASATETEGRNEHETMGKRAIKKPKK